MQRKTASHGTIILLLGALCLLSCGPAWLVPAGMAGSVPRQMMSQQAVAASALTVGALARGRISGALMGGCFAACLLPLLLARGSRMGMASVAPFGCIEDGATDPSLFIQTNVNLGDKKMDFMKAASKAVAESLGKPESYVAVSVQDGQDIIWGGSDAPCALCKVISLGSINKENNGALTKKVSELLAEFDVPPNRIYVNFFDLERQNVGYNGATFAG
ncbi:unnamed protein product [Symbiodinium pilosum]|uniref:L-dopachrome isomerase n=1 Tax=Symbiodinium pilosum TaxID=2952 RepID=A0A812VCK0_SYMPI|nr:unnamed protein product [Symbiodinium pilosum]